MSPSEKVRVIVVLAAVMAVYISAAVILAGGLLRRIGRKPAPKRGAIRRWSRRAVLVLAVGGIGCAAYSYFIEPYRLAETHVLLTSEKLPGGSRAVRIVHISDLHCDPKVRLEEMLPDVIAAMNPDVIVFTGDAVNSRDALPIFKRCMKRLAQIAPTFAIEGNWDGLRALRWGLYGGTGVRLLEDEATTLKIGEAEICLIGESLLPRKDRLAALRSAPPGAFKVVLHHYPNLIYEAAELKADLYLAGHTHGGQVALPWYGALVTLSRYGKRFESGLYHVQDTWMYVNRGIGMEGGPLPRVRFCARPEVTLIEVRPTE
ncbi:MAG: metallophosphoesterase [Acidobacteriota bacterium]